MGDDVLKLNVPKKKIITSRRGVFHCLDHSNFDHNLFDLNIIYKESNKIH